MLALLSTTTKDGLDSFARSLVQMGWELWATEGTAAFLQQAGIPVTSTSEILGARPIMGGRVKTLHWYVFASLLCDRSDKQHLRDAEQCGVRLIDMVVADIYPFEAYLEGGGAEFSKARSFIDIGGVGNIRAAAKNFECVIPLIDQQDYQRVSQQLAASNGLPHGVSRGERARLAAKVFERTALHDRRIGEYLAKQGEQIAS